MIDKQQMLAAAQSVGVTLDDTALERFDLYAKRLVETNKTLNLTAITAPEEIVYKHFADCLCLLREAELPQNAKVIDVGTGAGFPGLVLLIARPDLRMTLLDSTQKRLTFVKETAEVLGLAPDVVHLRAEEAGRSPTFRERFDLATARAVANLNVLSEYCLPLLKVGGVFAAMKGAKAADEMQSAQGAIRLLGGAPLLSREYTLPLCGERTVLCVKKISQTPTKYPRPSAQIAKRPLE